jgi:hypothetical protein
MNDLIVYAGIGILLIGLPVLFARLKATKHWIVSSVQEDTDYMHFYLYWPAAINHAAGYHLNDR